jgi:hypothetical protein
MNNSFVAKVIDVNDPEKAGRVKIRVFGEHDDVARIPDDMLPWARCVFPVTAAISGGVSGPTNGAVVGTTMIGYYADDDRQVPLVTGTLGRVTEETSDFSKASIGEDFNTILENSIFYVGSAELKYAAKKTIGSIESAGQSISDAIKSIGEGDIAGAVSKIKSSLRDIKTLKNLVRTAPDQFRAIVSGYISDANSMLEGELNNAIDGIIPQGSIPSIPGGDIDFSSINHLIGSIGTRLSKRDLENIEDIINRIGGSSFTMGSTMTQLENAFSDIKSFAAKNKSALDEINGAMNEVNGVLNTVNSIIK